MVSRWPTRGIGQTLELARSILEADGTLEESCAQISFNKVKINKAKLATYDVKAKMTSSLLKLEPGWAIEVNQSLWSPWLAKRGGGGARKSVGFFPPTEDAELKDIRIKERTDLVPCTAKVDTYLTVDGLYLIFFGAP